RQKLRATVVAPIVCVGGAVRGVGYLRGKFRSGCLLPGQIVSTKPLLVASVSDLSNGGDQLEYTMVVIKKIPASYFKAAPRPPVVGDSCPVCALYGGSVGKPAWDRFDPDPVWLATDNADVVARAMEQVPEDGWAELDAALAKVEQPYRVGR